MVHQIPPAPADPFQPHIECPKCGRHTIVMHGDSRYVCLSCNWFRDLGNERDYSYNYNSARVNFWIFVLIALIIVFIASR